MSNTDDLFPPMKNGHPLLPEAGGRVYIPTVTIEGMHVVGGLAKVVEVDRKRPVRRSVLKVEVEGHVYIFLWDNLQQQYLLWQTWGRTAARLPTEEEALALKERFENEALEKEEIRKRQEEAIAKYESSKANRHRQPDYDLKVKDRNSDAQAKIGVAWAREDGSVSIKLNPCVVLSWKDDLMITLFLRTS